MHFVIYVTGNDIDAQMAPFQEGVNDKYEAVPIEDLLAKEEILAKPENMMSFLKEILDKQYRLAIVEPEAIKDDYTIRHLHLADIDRIITYDELKKQWCALLKIDVSYNGRWDWWVVGGRWRDFLKAKPGYVGHRDTSLDELEKILPWPTDDGKGRREGWYDSLLVGQIDWEGMEQDWLDKCLPRYDDFHAWLEKNPVLTWKQFIESKGIDESNSDYALRNQLRNEYLEIPKVLEANKLFGYAWSDLIVDREEYIKFLKYSSRIPFGYLHEGNWVERDEYSWFGLDGRLTESNLKYLESVDAWLKSLPDDTLLTVVDYHC